MRLAIVVAATLWFTGCSVTPPAPTSPVIWREHQAHLEQLQYWTLNARLAVNNGIESWHLSLAWQQQGDSFVINLTGPLGTGRVQLRGSNGGVYLDDGEHAPLYAEDADSLLYESTGLRVPISGLRYWVRGLPDPRVAADHRVLEGGRLSHLQQGGWQLRYRRYQTVMGTVLPQKLFMQRDDLDVRLVIDEWQLGLPNS